ncbi:Uncharacterized protein FWK35_00007599 [Aphis craccivora]|uniref:Uncharacterized protein n=1 Tax=Aphis craccivora TaxID=307492 RepID=A0A6G0Z7P1_APHCR|nr:Uncharacterized protein FWK35_00007599 [Aphis craccivora]
MTCGPFSHPPSHRYIVIIIIITATDRSHRLHVRHICAARRNARVSDMVPRRDIPRSVSLLTRVSFPLTSRIYT